MEGQTLKKIKILLIVVVLGVIGFIGYKIYDEMKVIDFNIKAHDGLQISVDGLNFKEELTKEDIINAVDTYSRAVNQVPNKLGSISSSGGLTNGMMDMFYVDYTNGSKSLTAIKQEEINCHGSGECSDKYYVAFDVFVLAKEPVDLYLKDSSSVLSQIGNGKNSYYNASRVAFVVKGTVTEENKSHAQLLTGGISSVIWEPNYDNNKEKKNELIPYKAVSAEIKDSLSVGQIEGNFNFSNVSPSIYTKASNDEGKKITSIQAGVTKLRIYMWVESQDVDMKPKAFANKLNFNIDLGLE